VYLTAQQAKQKIHLVPVLFTVTSVAKKSQPPPQNQTTPLNIKAPHPRYQQDVVVGLVIYLVVMAAQAPRSATVLRVNGSVLAQVVVVQLGLVGLLVICLHIASRHDTVWLATPTPRLKPVVVAAAAL
jgi:hypothetical protein